MDMSVTDRPDQLSLAARQGTNFHKEADPFDSRSERDGNGNPVRFDFIAADATARLDLYRENETLVTSFSTEGDAPGVITLGSEGQVDFDMSSDDLAEVAATMSVAGVIHAPLRGDLVITCDGVPYWGARATFEIARSPE